MRFLTSESVQPALEQCFRASAASSLLVERALASTKRSEAPRLYHVAIAGRNHTLLQHLRQRAELLERAEAASVALRRAMALSLHNLASQLRLAFAQGVVAGGSLAAQHEFIAGHQTRVEAEPRTPLGAS